MNGFRNARIDADFVIEEMGDSSMFWRRREQETSGVKTRVSGPLAEPERDQSDLPPLQTIKLERGTMRAASIPRVVEELGRRGEEMVELFKEVVSPTGARAVFPIHLRRGEEDVFLEVETSGWETKTVNDVLRTAAVLRGSEYSSVAFEVLGAYPVPHLVRYFSGRSPAALLQLHILLRENPRDASINAEAFRGAALSHWNIDLHYNPDELPSIENLLLSTLNERTQSGESAPVLDALVRGYGCYAGEVLRHHTTPHSSWRLVDDWGESLVVEFPDATADPIGKARAFLENGPEDSVAYYVSYVMEELNG